MTRYIQQDQYTVGGLNSENEKIQESFRETLSRYGDSPNAMENNLDMNSHRILNLLDAIQGQEPITLSQFRRYVQEQKSSEQTQIDELLFYVSRLQEDNIDAYHIR